MKRYGTVAAAGAVALTCACAGQTQVNLGAQAPAIGATASAQAPAAAQKPPTPVAAPTVQIDDATRAIVGSQVVPFDGVAEGLEWPALARALPTPRPSPVVVQIARTVPTATVLRAVFTLRASDVHLQTADEKGAVYAVDLPPKPAQPAADKRCHLAAFLEPGGSVHVAAPGGASEYPSADAFARALDAARIECPLRYVAFGASAGDQAWGGVFDLIVAVDRAGAADGARYVLADAVRPPPRDKR